MEFEGTTEEYSRLSGSHAGLGVSCASFPESKAVSEMSEEEDEADGKRSGLLCKYFAKLIRGGGVQNRGCKRISNIDELLVGVRESTLTKYVKLRLVVSRFCFTPNSRLQATLVCHW